MTQRRVSVEKYMWDDVRDEMTFVFREEATDFYPVPAMPPGAVWYGTPGRSVTLTVPIKRAVESPPVGSYTIFDAPTNRVRLYRVTWTGNAWGAPVEDVP